MVCCISAGVGAPGIAAAFVVVVGRVSSGIRTPDVPAAAVIAVSSAAFGVGAAYILAVAVIIIGYVAAGVGTTYVFSALIVIVSGVDALVGAAYVGIKSVRVGKRKPERKKQNRYRYNKFFHISPYFIKTAQEDESFTRGISGRNMQTEKMRKNLRRLNPRNSSAGAAIVGI